MCLHLLTGYITRNDLNSESNCLMPRWNMFGSLEKRSCPTFTEEDQKNEDGKFFYNRQTEKNENFVVCGLFTTAIMCCRQWVAFTTVVSVKNDTHLWLRRTCNLAVRKQLGELRRICTQIEDSTVFKMWRVLVAETAEDNHLSSRVLPRKIFCRRSSTERQFVAKILIEKVFGDVYWKIGPPDSLIKRYEKFRAVCRKTS